jgi:ArsR family transcriptional regulator, arsenate/arsenite/antimonite-responsive transcriptional repressor
MKDILALARALSDEGRVRALLALRGGELCVCQIVELLGLATSTVSAHLSVLKEAGLVQARKQGRWIYYRLAECDQSAPARRAMAWLCESLCDDAAAREDAARLKTILSTDPEVLCCKQRPRSSACCSSAPATRAGARWPKAGPAASRPA